MQIARMILVFSLLLVALITVVQLAQNNALKKLESLKGTQNSDASVATATKDSQSSAGNPPQQPPGYPKDVPISEFTKEQRIAWCNDITKNSIYTLGSKLNCTDNTNVFNVGIMICVFLTVVIEIATHKLQGAISSRTIHELINKVYRELMILGVISFLIGFLESTRFFEVVFSAFSTKDESDIHSVTERRVKIFELVHIVLFVLSIFYVINVIISYYITKYTKSKWKRFESAGFDFALHCFSTVTQQYRSNGICGKLFNFPLLYQYSRFHEQFSYWGIRSRFILANRLPSNFRFDLYLEKRVQHLFSSLIELPARIWAILFFAAFFNVIRLMLWDYLSQDSGITFFVIIFGLGALANSIFSFIYIRVGYALYVRWYTSKQHQDLGRQVQDNGLANRLMINNDDEDTASSTSNLDDVTISSIVMHKYFPFRSPSFALTLLQIGQLVQAFFLAIVFLRYFYVIFLENIILPNVALQIIVFIVILTPTVVNSLLFYPLTLGPFTVLSSVENLTNFERVKQVLEEMKHGIHEHEHELTAPYFDSVTHSQKLLWKKFIKQQMKKAHKRLAFVKSRVASVENNLCSLTTGSKEVIDSAAPLQTELNELGNSKGLSQEI